MVLHRVLGGWKGEHSVELAQEEVARDLSLGCFGDL